MVNKGIRRTLKYEYQKMEIVIVEMTQGVLRKKIVVMSTRRRWERINDVHALVSFQNELNLTFARWHWELVGCVTRDRSVHSFLSSLH